MKYRIADDSGLYWSNLYGWTDAECCDTFSEVERAALNLPIGGHWEAL